MSHTPSLRELEQPDAFIRRHIGPDAAEQQSMLETLGVASLAELIEQTLPQSIAMGGALALDEPRTETQVLAYLKGLASRNQIFTSCIGMGYHDTITPPVVLRNVLENPGWYTAYTPY